jgi:pimeloyl-ACP methyl ester carboxylesterase
MTDIALSFHPVGNGHALALQEIDDNTPNSKALKILMIHGGPGYYWQPDNLLLLHKRLSDAGHDVCLQALHCRACGIGDAVSRYNDILDDNLLKRAHDLSHFGTPDILLGHSTGAMIVLAGLMENTIAPRETLLVSPYTASLGEHDYWINVKSQKYPRAFKRFHDFVTENWQTYKGGLPADLDKQFYHYWGELFTALPDRDLQIKAHLIYGNFHVLDALPHMGTHDDGEPYIIHHTLLEKWPDYNDTIKDNLWRTGSITANWWRGHYQHDYPFFDKLTQHAWSENMHILSGMDDEITPPETVLRLADLLGTKPELVVNCGHLPEANVQGQLDIALADTLGRMCKDLKP